MIQLVAPALAEDRPNCIASVATGVQKITIYISEEEKVQLKTLAEEQGTPVIDISQWVLNAGGAGISGPLLINTENGVPF